jgi:hypothetical protein
LTSSTSGSSREQGIASELSGAMRNTGIAHSALFLFLVFSSLTSVVCVDAAFGR